MTNTHLIIAYFASLLTFIAIDAIWLGKVAPKMYKKYIGHLMASKPDFMAALLFYLVFIAGLVVFVINPAINYGGMHDALWRGGLFGLVCYSTFDLTSQAVFKNWPKKITMIDLLWGAFITSVCSVISFELLTRYIIG